MKKEEPTMTSEEKRWAEAREEYKKGLQRIFDDTIKELMEKYDIPVDINQTGDN